MARQATSALVAGNIKRLRIDRGFSQKVLATLMQTYHAVPQSWNDQKIGELEHSRKGRERNITVDDLVAVSHALSVELWQLLLPPAVNDENREIFADFDLDTYSFRLFGMAPDQIRRDAQSLIRWPKLQLSPQQIRLISMRHPEAIRVRATWWGNEIASGREPTSEGWGAALEEIVTECETELSRLMRNEEVIIPDELQNLAPDRNFNAYCIEADAFWEDTLAKETK